MSPLHVVVMGVSGSGKTTLAQDLAARTGWSVLEADDLYPGEYMSQFTTSGDSGSADSGADAASAAGEESTRQAWLGRVTEWMSAKAKGGSNTVIACTALTKAHREILNEVPGVVFYVHLYGTMDVVVPRSPQNLPQEMLQKQLAALQRLQPEELGIQLNVSRPYEERVEDALAAAAFAQKNYAARTGEDN